MSLISAIKDAIFTETSSDIIINERSFISVMLDSNSNESIDKNAFRVHSYKGKSFVLTRHVIHFIVTYLVLGSLWLLYFLYNVGYKIITGKWRGVKSSSGINLIIGSTVFVTGIIVLIYILAFLIKDVVLSPNNARINNKGVITVDQPCLETHSFFLLNAATYWTSTDIQISEGDKVFVSASGSMYSDIDNMCRAAEKNDTLDYPRSLFAPNSVSRHDTTVKYCIYGRYDNDRFLCGTHGKQQEKSNEEYPHYGSLLYQICKNHKGAIDYNNGNNEYVVKQMNFTKGNEFELNLDEKQSGILYLTFNDILLDEDMFNIIKKDSSEMWQTLKNIGINSVHKIKDGRIWFQDNLGEVLVNVRIEKSIWESDLPWYKKPIVYVYRNINKFSKHGFVRSGAWINLTILLAWFLADILISLLIKKDKLAFIYKISFKKIQP